VSDDRDEGDAADGGAGDATAKTPLVNRPQRPTGKRTRQGSGAGALAEPEEVEEALTEEFEALVTKRAERRHIPVMAGAGE